MKNLGIILGFVVLSLAGFIGWQIGAWYVADSQLQSDMQDLAVQSPFRIGLAEAASEDELRDAVMARAKAHGIQLEPQQITVQRTFTSDVLSVSLAADYEERVNLLAGSLTLHFAPSSVHSAQVTVK